MPDTNKPTKQPSATPPQPAAEFDPELEKALLRFRQGQRSCFPVGYDGYRRLDDDLATKISIEYGLFLLQRKTRTVRQSGVSYAELKRELTTARADVAADVLKLWPMDRGDIYAFEWTSLDAVKAALLKQSEDWLIESLEATVQLTKPSAGQILLKARAGRTVEQFAKALGVSETIVYAIARDKPTGRCNMEKIKLIASKIGCSPQDLLPPGFNPEELTRRKARKPRA
jgi:hypothetical protein